MKIYTGGGDRGRTSLFSGERVVKNHSRVRAYGDVDELNSVLGVLEASLPEQGSDIVPEIRKIQSELFQVGAWLATTPGSPAIAFLEKITENQIRFLENVIDRMEEELRPLTGFILPGGHISAAVAHVARTVCRRAERHVVELSSECGEDDGCGVPLGEVIVYLNRLSDYLFVLARYCNQIAGVKDILWKK